MRKTVTMCLRLGNASLNVQSSSFSLRFVSEPRAVATGSDNTSASKDPVATAPGPGTRDLGVDVWTAPTLFVVFESMTGQLKVNIFQRSTRERILCDALVGDVALRIGECRKVPHLRFIRR